MGYFREKKENDFLVFIILFPKENWNVMWGAGRGGGQEKRISLEIILQ